MNLKAEKSTKNRKILKFWKFLNFFENFSEFQAIVFSQFFKLSWQSSSQKTSPWSPQFNGVHQKFVWTLVRALRAKADTPWYRDFCISFKISWAGVRFPRAQPRSRTSSVCQSILLIMEMILHTLIAIVALKAAEINRSEVTKKVDTFAPPHVPNTR